METARLRLRPLTPDDLEHLVALHGDPEVMAFISGAGETREVVEARSLPDLLARRTWLVFEGETFLGWASLRVEGDEAELGYRLVRAAWGRGYASEASRALVELGFRDLGLSRIWAQTMAVNAGSRRVMEKAGLRYIRTFHLTWDDPLPGAEQGEVEYAIARTGWR
ncbi:MAG: GNAT family N-acetyltransferase [Phenylobacterium sp.]|uniref:GNAT family N-acetyltransferase n=1 Tax=Phenylobacterium sp. TaxID=1871053 RepID=UPI001B4223B9|nr:GNAT family N-acetyltransferase [Phenylobacterium sp.]MBP7650867.1 GNAT family N-acetyltransferase [Phenylobacterium sp.]MBP7815948.1 GNAT family N-acetyltransferase [Phenylobacterium sp.]MBP9231977.1 GNAT family N-acetyltransferase [Phenylobacterium sp.]MBP9756879.1 GNAT family N-acetyltransferase [Phenylobacterium sp.]